MNEILLEMETQSRVRLSNGNRRRNVLRYASSITRALYNRTLIATAHSTRLRANSKSLATLVGIHVSEFTLISFGSPLLLSRVPTTSILKLCLNFLSLLSPFIFL